MVATTSSVPAVRDSASVVVTESDRKGIAANAVETTWLNTPQELLLLLLPLLDRLPGLLLYYPTHWLDLWLQDLKQLVWVDLDKRDKERQVMMYLGLE